MNRDRKRGALIGLAVGDALGAAVEFKEPGTFAPVTCYRSGGPHSLAAGQWTDDTSMALALADSIGSVGWNLNDQAARYAQWFQEGKYSVNGFCFDIGCTTRTALNRFLETGDASTSGLSDPQDSGNGGIMRIAPVAIRYAEYEQNWDACVPMLYHLGAESSSVTHASAMCKSCAAYMTVVLAALMRGQSREEALSYQPWCDDLEPFTKLIAAGEYKRRDPHGSGFVIESLMAALWAFHDAKDFEEAVLKAVNLGLDADTTGAICGQFAGAYWGESGIPQSLRDGLDRKDMLEQGLTCLGV
jgi:ADP-ribosyl-[dinitrogen reductase] hydrolase